MMLRPRHYSTFNRSIARGITYALRDNNRSKYRNNYNKSININKNYNNNGNNTQTIDPVVFMCVLLITALIIFVKVISG